MARYFGGFRDRLLKKGRSSPLSDRDVDWVKVSGTAIWSPEKRDYTWLDPGNYLTSFLKEGAGLFQDPAPSEDTPPPKKKEKPMWDLGALANEPDAEESYTPPTGLFSSGGMATPRPDVEAELPSIDEYKNELLSALRRRGLRVDVRKIALPEDVERDLLQFHGGDKRVDSQALRARLQVFKRQVIESFDQFSRVGETYIIPHAPRYPGFEPERPTGADGDVPETIELQEPLPSFEDGPILFEAEEPIHGTSEDPVDESQHPREIEGIDSDYESFVLKSLDKLEASMGGSGSRTPADTPLDRSGAKDSDYQAGEAERPAGSRRIYDPLNGTLDIPRKASEAGPRLRPAPGADAPVDAPGPSRFSAAPNDGAPPPGESWIVSPVQSRKSYDLDRSITPPSEEASRKEASAGKPHELARPKKPEVLKAFQTLRTPPVEPPPPSLAEPPAKDEDAISDARLQALSILARLDPPTGDGHAVPSDLATSGEAPEPRPSFPALESIASAIADERRSAEPASSSPSRSQSLSDFLLSLKNENEEHHVATSKSSQSATQDLQPSTLEETRSPDAATPTTPPEEMRFPRPVEEKKRTLALFAKPERRAYPKSESPHVDEPNPLPDEEAVHVEALDNEVMSVEALDHAVLKDESPGEDIVRDDSVAPAQQVLEPTGAAEAEKESATEADVVVGTSWLRGVSAAFIAAVDEEIPKVEPQPAVEKASPLQEPVASEPAVSEPAVSEPAVSEPAVSEPVAAELVASEPVVSGQQAVEPPDAASEAVAADPSRETVDEHQDPHEERVLETRAPAHVFSEQPTPASIPEARPVASDDAASPSRTTHNFMAEHMAVPEDTDQRHAERLTRSAREALEALESREVVEEVRPSTSRPVEQPALASEPPARRAESEEAPVVSDYEAKLDGVVEALAFAADDPIPLARVSRVFSEVSGERRPTDAQVTESVERLNGLYSRLNRAFRVKIWAGGIRMATDPGYAEYIRAIYKQDRPKKLSRTLMETLAIIAYSQPTTKPEVDFIRGVDSDYAVRKLLEMGLVDIVGRSEAIGKPLLYGTSERFLEQFGLSELAALPKLKEIEELLDDPSLQRERMHLMALESGLDGERGEAETAPGGEEGG